MPTRSLHRWRVLVTPHAPGAFNMALDEALMSRARRTGEWVARIYGWAPHALSLGRNQSAAGAYDLDQIGRRGLDVVRRPTGGRAILHAHEITYSVTAPESAAAGLRETYHRINLLLEHAIASLGAPVAIARAGRESAPGLIPCFDRPSSGELVAEGRKLAGSAQWRQEGAFLQHGSILVDGDQSLVATLLRHPLPPPEPPATLRELVGRAPELGEFAGAFAAAIGVLEGSTPELIDSPEHWVMIEAKRLERRYLDPAWTWRR